LISSRSWAKSLLVAGSFLLISSSILGNAFAEKTLMKDDDWTVYTDGRAGAFLSYVRGDGYPRNKVDTSGNMNHDVVGGGMEADADRQPVQNGAPGQLTQGTVESMRIRSGFVSNTLGFGVRGPLDATLTFTGYIQLWAYVESEGRQKNRPNPVDVRQGYAKVEGPWGSVLAGRSRTLFSRGATDIDALYAHRYGVGFPGTANVDNYGPTSGHIGFGVLGSGYASGLVYATPRLSGFQLSAGVFDPITLQGAWPRTKWVRPEAEATYEHPIRQLGKFVLFANGAYQKVYKLDSPDDTSARGVGYGGRLELGPVRLGVAGHYGRGLGLNYALEVSSASLDQSGNMRKFDGYYVQSQVVLGKVDLSAGWGITRVFLVPTRCDRATGVCTGDNVADANMNIPHSIIKYQMGISAGVVYHMRDWLHLDLDYFRAQFAWYLGEKQVVNVVNTGMTFTW
jgi:hypothetical protein